MPPTQDDLLHRQAQQNESAQQQQDPKGRRKANADPATASQAAQQTAAAPGGASNEGLRSMARQTAGANGATSPGVAGLAGAAGPAVDSAATGAAGAASGPSAGHAPDDRVAQIATPQAGASGQGPAPMQATPGREPAVDPQKAAGTGGGAPGGGAQTGPDTTGAGPQVASQQTPVDPKAAANQQAPDPKKNQPAGSGAPGGGAAPTSALPGPGKKAGEPGGGDQSGASGPGGGGAGGPAVDQAQTAAGPDAGAAQQAAGGGGPGAYDVDFIAREYAFHEAWQKVPDAEKNQVVSDITGVGAQPGGGATLTREQRAQLLWNATGRGAALGGLDVAKDELLKFGLKKLGAFAATKGLGKAIPFVGVAVGAFDLGSKLWKIKETFGKPMNVLNDPSASEIDKTIAKLTIAKEVISLLSAVLGMAGAICGAIAVLTSWTLVGGVSFGAAAAILAAVSFGLGIAETAIDIVIAGYRREKVLTMEGDPEAVLAEIAKYETSVRDGTKGTIKAGREAKKNYTDIKALQVKTRTDAETHITQDKVQASASGTQVAGFNGQTGQPALVAQTQSRVLDAQHLEMHNQSTTVQSRGVQLPLHKPVAAPTLESASSTTQMSASRLHVESHSGSAALNPSAGPIDVMASRTRSSSISMSSTQLEHSSRSNSVTGTAGYNMLDRSVGETAAKGQGLKMSKVADKAAMEALGLGKDSPEAILGRNGGALPTSDPNTSYQLDPATGKGMLRRTLPLTPMPKPPFVYPETIERADRIRGLLHKEAFLGQLVADAQGVDATLGQELGPKGQLAQWESFHKGATDSLGDQRAAIAQKEGKVKTAAGLVGEMTAEDQKGKGKADNALQSSEVQAVSDATNNSFLRTVVGGGAGIAKAGAAVVNFVGGVFGADEPVIDTKAIDKVQALFGAAPKVKSGKAGLAGKSGDLGGAGAKAQKPIQEKQQKIQQAKAQQGAATDAAQQFGAGVKEGKVTLQANKQDQKAWVAKVQADLQLTSGARQKEEASFRQEMGQTQAWAAQHFQVRQLNQQVITSAGQNPARRELAPDTVQQVSQATSTIDQSVAAHNGKRDQLAALKGQALAQVAAASGKPASSAHAAAMNQALTQFEQRLAGHVGTLDAMKASLQTVEPAQLPAAFEAVQKTLRAIDAAVAMAFQAYAKALNELAQAAAEENQAQATATKQAAAG